MATVEIATSRLTLVLQTPEEVIALIEALPPAERAEVSPDFIARMRAFAPGDLWSLGFKAFERVSGSNVGGCAFKGPPDAEGVVEVAYYTDEAHRGNGYATEAARALTEFAFASGRVRVARAYTLPENAASGRVLEKCGFTSLGLVTDPEDGLVCRWERRREEGVLATGPDRS